MLCFRKEVEFARHDFPVPRSGTPPPLPSSPQHRPVSTALEVARGRPGAPAASGQSLPGMDQPGAGAGTADVAGMDENVATPAPPDGEGGAGRSEARAARSCSRGVDHAQEIQGGRAEPGESDSAVGPVVIGSTRPLRVYAPAESRSASASHRGNRPSGGSGGLRGPASSRLPRGCN